jgi:hypothetical protein
VREAFLQDSRYNGNLGLALICLQKETLATWLQDKYGGQDVLRHLKDIHHYLYKLDAGHSLMPLRTNVCQKKDTWMSFCFACNYNNSRLTMLMQHVALKSNTTLDLYKGSTILVILRMFALDSV